MEVPPNSPWRDLPEGLGPFLTAHERLIRRAVDGTWEKIFAAVLAAADPVDDIGRAVVITGATRIARRGHEYRLGGVGVARSRGLPSARRVTSPMRNGTGSVDS